MSKYITPSIQREQFIELRYKLLKESVNQEYFHATEDKQLVRDELFGIIKSLHEDLIIDSIIAQKNKVNPSLYLEKYYKKEKLIKRVVGAAFYERVCRTLLQYVFMRSHFQEITSIVVVLGAIFTGEKQSFILKTLKQYLKQHFAKPFEIYFHQAKADINCQIADYIGWAIAIKWERNEERSYKFIKEKIKSEYEVFKKGTTIYF